MVAASGGTLLQDLSAIALSLSSAVQLYSADIKISLKAHKQAMPVSWIMENYGIPHFVSSICWMLDLGDNGTSTCLWEYGIRYLPLPFQYLDIWTYFCLVVPALNDFYEPEHTSIYCRPSSNQMPEQFTPVYVEINPDASVIHCMLYF